MRINTDEKGTTRPYPGIEGWLFTVKYCTLQEYINHKQGIQNIDQGITLFPAAPLWRDKYTIRVRKLTQTEKKENGVYLRAKKHIANFLTVSQKDTF